MTHDKQQHTPETEFRLILTGNVIDIETEDRLHAQALHLNHPGIARRIVACVNWCKGIDTEYLEGSAGDVGTLHAQRDELAAALRLNAEQVYAEFMKLAPAVSVECLDRVQEHVKEWRAALAKVQA